MGKKFRAIIFLLCVLLLSACKAPTLETLSTFIPAQLPPSFNKSLSRGYDLLAQYEAYNIGDEAAAARFREKSRLGNKSMPDNPANADVSGKEAKEITVAYGMLMRTIDAYNRSGNGLKLAEAQVNYDCWLERFASKQKSGDQHTAQWCRERFYAAIESLTRAGPKHFAVYFDVNTAVPDAAAFSIIRQAAAAYAEREEDGWHVRLTGRSDPKGNPEQNMILSMRRALAVRNVLAQNGVDPGKVSIAAVGEKKKAGAVSFRAEQARRVDIAVIPPSMDRPEKGDPDITKILPQYFGPEGLDM